ncbi:MAG TPA: ABC transporter substrate-binding protein [Bosea sp. (in: a-proteobacteria)]|jgi:peptide/nickel transport system substrate-binding protein|uniref:ABC transporter substrate-binding protein n=1 Tax=Bosea sp. (in: a-proteobacteria) TaxID=1871050 RepID=UPI002E0F72DE|nr:ABC transporter substrate-binding protein [Bosea sp. (in: a-proteobacteria)]
MDRRQFLKASAVTAFLPAAPLIARAQDAKTLRFVPYSDVAIIDPIWTNGYSTRTHALLVWDTLYGLDDQFQPQPQMVEGHLVEDDGKRWTLTLRPGLVFHDGSKVLARDAVASIRRWGARDTFGQALMAATEELSAPDDRTILFRLRRPFPQLPAALARPSALVAAIMPERLAQTDPFKQIPEAIGSGPYRYLTAERIAGARHVYARHEGYVPREGTPSFTAGPRTPLLDRIEFNVMPDPATAVSALQTGAVDWVEQPIIDLLPLLRKDPNITVAVKDRSGMAGQLRLNHLQPPFSNPAIRRVVLKAINQEDCMNAVCGGDPEVERGSIGFFPSNSAMASEVGIEALKAPKDFGKLKQELEAAGYKGERVIFLSGQDVPRIALAAEVAADALRKIGMNVDFVAADWGTVLQRISNRSPVEQGGWGCYITYWSGLDLGSPATSSPLRGNGAKGSPGWPDSPAIEALRARWLEAPDLAGQKAIAQEIQLQAMQDVPYVPAGQYFQPVAYRKNLTGMLNGVPVFTNLRKG